MEEIQGRIFYHVRQRITLIVTSQHDQRLAWRADDIRSLARAIHGHPTITSFEGGEGIPNDSLDALHSALAALPALESIKLSNRLYLEDESALANLESLTDLLRLPFLRSVCFCLFDFTRAFSQATANAFIIPAVITKLEFRECSFSGGDCVVIVANGLARNTSVVSIGVAETQDGALIGALAAALPSNSTLRELSFLRCSVNDVVHLFSALGENMGLEALKVDGFGAMDESLCTAMQDGLALNKTLESLELMPVPLRYDNDDLWAGRLRFSAPTRLSNYWWSSCHVIVASLVRRTSRTRQQQLRRGRDDDR